MLKKFLVTASVAGLMAGAASALEVLPAVQGNAGTPAVGTPRVLATQLDYSGGAVVTGDPLNAGEGNLRFAFYPTGGTFPTGNVLLRVEVTGATFTSALTGAEVTSAGTSVISEDGAKDGAEVTFLLSNVSTCGGPAAVLPQTFGCFVDLPLELSSGNVSVKVGLETDAGAPIDNTSKTILKSAVLSLGAPAFNIGIFAEQDITPTTVFSALGGGFSAFGITGAPTLATLASEYTDLTDNVPGLGVGAPLGWFVVEPNEVVLATTPALVTERVHSSIDGTEVDAGDIADVNVSVSGNMDAFEDGAFNIAGTDVGADADTDLAEDSDTAYFGAGAVRIDAEPDLVTIIARSDYEATVEVEVLGSSDLTDGQTLTAPIDDIGRQGTEVTFPWTQTATQGEASGATSVFRIGNLMNDDTGAVYAEVRNASEAGFTSAGIVKLADAIDGGSEFVINSADLEDAVGNYGRGDVNFIVEADNRELTARQFVVRNGVIQQVIGGNVFQDQ